MSKKDWCTWFFENWYSYTEGKIYLGKLCKEHDKQCSSTVFAKLLWKHKVVGGSLIWLIASTACWIKYFKHMKERV
jgi:hypothetical protein